MYCPYMLFSKKRYAGVLHAFDMASAIATAAASAPGVSAASAWSGSAESVYSGGESNSSFGTLDVKGLQNVRRDSCLLLRETMDRCLHLILREDDLTQAQHYVRQTVGFIGCIARCAC